MKKHQGSKKHHGGAKHGHDARKQPKTHVVGKHPQHAKPMKSGG